MPPAQRDRRFHHVAAQGIRQRFRKRTARFPAARASGVSIARASADTPITHHGQDRFADPDSELEEIQKALSAPWSRPNRSGNRPPALNAVLGADQIAVLEESRIVALRNACGDSRQRALPGASQARRPLRQ